MNANFTFPRQRAPIPRPALAHTANHTTSSKAEPSDANRESNALRASVLDAALQLGIGHNSTVTNWMFNNTLEEEDEEVSSMRPLLYTDFFILITYYYRTNPLQV
jgi:hypothetical protein